MTGFYAGLIRNHPFANIAFAVVLVLGALAYLAMPREQDPEINFNWVMVTAILPGAAAEDVEKRVTKPLEDAIKGVADVRFVMSSSRENVVSILVRFRDIDERSFDKRINDLRRDIQNKAKSELPPEAKDPRVMEITTSNGFPTAMVLVTGQAADEVLRLRARQFKEDIERIAGVDQVFPTGLRDPELQVDFDPMALANRGLTAADVSDNINAWFRDTFAGKVEVQGDAERAAWLVRVVGQSADPEELARIPVASARSREPVPLGQIAEVSRGRAKAGSLASYQGKGAVILAVTKKSQTNTLKLVEQVNDYIATQNPRFAAEGVQMQLLDDQTVPTREAITTMERNAIQGLLIVLAITWLFLGTRVALLIGLGIPFSLAGTFAILHALGYTLNISVLLGVVIALGMLVDDAVVVVETIYYRMQRGEPVHSASVGAVREVFAPVTASVLTTVAAFLPLMLLPGIVGKFMFVIPFVVTLGLLISLIEAYWMLPAHMAVIAPTAGDGHLNNWRDRFNHLLRVKYSRALLWVLRRPKRSLVIAVGLMLGAVAAVGAGMVRIQFFAFDPIRLFYVNVDMPAGAPIEETLANAEKIEAAVRKHLKPDEARSMSSYAGVKFSDTEPLYGESYGQVNVSLNPRNHNGITGRDVDEIVESMRAEIEAIPTPGKITFTMISGGPPLAKPIKARVRNDEPQELRAAGDALLAIVRAVPGTRDVADDDVPGRPELVLALDRGALRAAGLDAARVARLVRLHADGEIVAMMRDKGEKLELRVRARHGSGKSAGTVGADITRLLDDPVALPAGGTTTLRALVREETRIGKGVIKHYNLRRAITVEADLEKAVTDTVAANKIIAAEWKKVANQFPNTDIDFSGELDDINESLDAMAVLFLMGVGLIYLILAAQFRSYFQPLLILVTVPLAFTGVVLGLLVASIPLSLYTLYGVIALTGIAVNSAIVLIDAANDRLASGMSVLHAAVYAARRRVVPIIITSVTTIGGLFSLAVGLGGKSLLWGPVAASIVWGLGFSTVLTLFVMPLMYWMAMRRFSGVRE
ncbi:efflux RND transporter permease subunit [Sulfuritalea sp.]|uniref:efflux RND transporter permease subunit n=1 Tax=Sulfuritalea sp. TaxID=2480090 RepID=UPI001AD3A086|nr:efflux RND transporter permease subunit [Sulfuritalea sp.]MBN8473907.1 efflux RND transporter permease subunit [Sulfuritalea sp.]